MTLKEQMNNFSFYSAVFASLVFCSLDLLSFARFAAASLFRYSHVKDKDTLSSSVMLTLFALLISLSTCAIISRFGRTESVMELGLDLDDDSLFETRRCKDDDTSCQSKNLKNHYPMVI